MILLNARTHFFVSKDKRIEKEEAVTKEKIGPKSESNRSKWEPAE